MSDIVERLKNEIEHIHKQGHDARRSVEACALAEIERLRSKADWEPAFRKERECADELVSCLARALEGELTTWHSEDDDPPEWCQRIFKKDPDQLPWPVREDESGDWSWSVSERNEVTLENDRLRAFVNNLGIETMHPHMGGYHQCRVRANGTRLKPDQWAVVYECRQAPR